MHTTSSAPASLLGSQGTYPSGGSTFVAPLPEDAYFDTNPGHLRLSHDGVHWTGSFVKILRALVTDQMDDGPLSMYVTRTTNSEPSGPLQKVSGTVTAVTEQDLIFEDGYTIPLDEVLDIEI